AAARCGCAFSCRERSRRRAHAAGPMNPTVLIFRADLLPPSETFIAAQARALRRFSRCFAGLRLEPCGLPLDPCETVVLTTNDGLANKLRRRLFMESGVSAPDFLRALERRRPVL